MLISYEYISLYTSNKQASQMLYIMKKYCDRNYTVVDANAGRVEIQYIFVSILNLYIVLIFRTRQ